MPRTVPRHYGADCRGNQGGTRICEGIEIKSIFNCQFAISDWNLFSPLRSGKFPQLPHNSYGRTASIATPCAGTVAPIFPVCLPRSLCSRGRALRQRRFLGSQSLPSNRDVLLGCAAIEEDDRAATIGQLLRPDIDLELVILADAPTLPSERVLIDRDALLCW